MKRSCLTGLLLFLLVASPPRLGGSAAGPNDLDILSVGVPPPVMILFDGSASMGHHMWDDDFNVDKQYPGVCGWALSPTIPGSSCPGLGNVGDECPDNDFVDIASGYPHINSATSGGPVFTHTCDPGGGDVTRNIYRDKGSEGDTFYSLNYLNWLFGVATTTQLANEPTVSRMKEAKVTLQDLVVEVNGDPTAGERVYFGLALLDSGNKAEGWQLKLPISSRSVSSIVSTIESLEAEGWTPISETLVDVGRYFAGDDGLGTYSDIKPSPIEFPCQNGWVILVSDGAPTQDLNDHEGPGGSDFMNSIGNYDGDANECAAVAPAHTTGCSDAPTTGRDDTRVYLSDGSDWLDDVAKYLSENDIRPSISGDQFVYTYTIGFVNNHPLLAETAANGQGKHFYTGPTGSGGLATEIRKAIIDIMERATSFTAATVPASRTNAGDAFYASYFIPVLAEPVWPGHLEAYRLRPDGLPETKAGTLALDSNGVFLEPRNPFWDAGAVLASNSSRTLYTTLQVTGSDTKVAFDSSFVDPNNPDTFLGLTTAGVEPSYPNYPASGITTLPLLRDAVVDYVHGQDAFDEDEDADSSELRDIVMGDIFHSSPVAVGAPPQFLQLEEGYGVSGTGTPFVDEYAQRDRVLYGGSNGGMLHAFEAGQYSSGDDPNTSSIVENGYWGMGTGAERFGYIPGFLLDQLGQLPINKPRSYYYVDGDPVVADAWLGDLGDPNDLTKDPADWTTVLIVGARQGGSGYLALDVTHPDAVSGNAHFPYPSLLWEFQDADLGDTWSNPVITRIKREAASGVGDKCGKDDGDGDCRELWVAIFAGGYDESGDPSMPGFEDDPAQSGWTDKSKAIYVVDLRYGTILAKAEYSASASDDRTLMKYSLPSTPTVLDLDFDGFADVVYVGDLGGQVWKWDLSLVGSDSDADGDVDNWPVGIFFASPKDVSSGHFRSLFEPPSASFYQGDLYMAFGTGERSDLAYLGDPSDDENNRFYVVKDVVPTGTGAFPGSLGESDLTDISGADSDTNPADSGFFFVAQDSEKFLTAHTVFAGQVITTSYIPDDDPITSPCDRDGESRLYIFSLSSGLGFYTDATTTGDAARRVSIGAGLSNDPRISISATGDKMYIQTSDGRLVATPPPPPPTPPSDVVYWLQNY